MTQPALAVVASSGSQFAILIFAVTFLSAAASEGFVRIGVMSHEDVVYVSRLLSFGIGAAALLLIPAFRKRAAALLSSPVPRARYLEVALVVVVAGAGQFALFGLNAALKWIAGGDEAVAAMGFSRAHSLDAAFDAATLRDLVIGCLMAPLLEEIFYRGLLFEAWARTRSVAAAIILSSAVFAMVHPFMIHAFFGGLVLCSLYVRTGALRASILVHFCANAFNWYPLLGQFLIPSHNQGIRSWTFQLVCLATAPLFVIGYAWLATQTRRPLRDGETCPAAA
jgi:membrane protease YdiL (CAAX protease family)